MTEQDFGYFSAKQYFKSSQKSRNFHNSAPETCDDLSLRRQYKRRTEFAGERTYFTGFCACSYKGIRTEHNRSDRMFEIHSILFLIVECIEFSALRFYHVCSDTLLERLKSSCYVLLRWTLCAVCAFAKETQTIFFRRGLENFLPYSIFCFTSRYGTIGI